MDMVLPTHFALCIVYIMGAYLYQPFDGGVVGLGFGVCVYICGMCKNYIVHCARVKLIVPLSIVKHTAQNISINNK